MPLVNEFRTNAKSFPGPMAPSNGNVEATQLDEHGFITRSTDGPVSVSSTAEV
jgi:hypothetical protein